MQRSEPVFFLDVVRARGTEDQEVEDVSLRVTSIEYQDSEKKADLLKVVLDNRDLAMFDHPIFEKGTELVVSWGYAGTVSPPRSCIVQKVSGSLSVSIEALDKGVLMHKATLTRTFENQKRSDVVRSIAAEHGYEGDNLHVEDTEVSVPSLVQAAQTDAQFLKKLADEEGFEFFVDFDGLHWHRRRTDQAPLRVLQYYLPPEVGDITGFNVENDVSAKPGAVTAKGRDPLAKKDIVETADHTTVARTTTGANPEVLPARVGETTLAARTEKVDPVTGATTVSYAFPPKTTPDGGASGEVRPTTATTAADAKRQASAVFTRTQQSAIKLSIDMVGDPNIVAKSVVEVRGLGQRLSGNYYVNEATHTIDSGGYKLKLKLSRDGTNKAGGKTVPGDKAKTNKKEGPEPVRQGETVLLEKVEKVDPTTGETTIAFKDTRGREAAPPPAPPTPDKAAP
jgi:phage protein D